MFSIRMLLCTAMMSVGFALASSTGTYADITRHCQAHYLVRHGAGLAATFPRPDFATAGTCGATVPDRCRVRARDRAHRCMQAHWDQRWTRNTVPADCLLRGGGISGYTVRDVKDEIERAACCTRSSPLRPVPARVTVERWSTGDGSCHHRAIISHYDVDCPQIRQRLCP
jgi:hypothetical protein